MTDSSHDLTLELLAKAQDAGELPADAGIAAAVVRGGDVLFQGAYGLRERDRGLPVTTDTRFEICSLTKGFTSAAVLAAVEAGRLDLDRPLNATKALVSLSDAEATRSVSLTDILSHRTGLPANDLLFYFGGLTNADVRRAVGELELVPGGFRKTFVYNNLLYGVLGGLFPELVGATWEKWVSQKLLGPLDMTSTSLAPPADARDLALPYVGTQRVPSLDTSAIPAAGAIRSSITDMARWLAFHLTRGKTPRGEQLFRPSSIELMQKAHVVATGVNPLILQGFEWLGEPSYGLGWFVGSAHGQNAVFQPGFADGFSAAMVLLPEKDLGCVVLSNVNLSPIPGRLAQTLLESALGVETSAQPRAPAAPEKALGFVGEYEHPAFGVIALARRGDQLVLRYRGHAWPLTWKDECSAEFAAPAFGVKLPLSVRCETTSAGTRQLAIPFSLDPRVGPQVFTERPSSR